MADIYNLTPYFCARRMAHQLLQHQGADFFALSEPDAPAFRLDPHKIAWVVNSAVNTARKAAPNLPTSPHDLDVCRERLQSDLLQKFVASHISNPR